MNESSDDWHTSTPVFRKPLQPPSNIAQPPGSAPASGAPIFGQTLTLNAEELFEITGYRQPGKICAQLTKQGIAYFPAPDGYPRVLRSSLESSASTRNTSRANRRPDFTALDRGRIK